jgi:hypothetical protein
VFETCCCCSAFPPALEQNVLRVGGGCYECKVTSFTFKFFGFLRKLFLNICIISEYLKAKNLNSYLSCAFIGRVCTRAGEHDRFYAKKNQSVTSVSNRK